MFLAWTLDATLTLTLDSGLPGKEVNHGTTFEDGDVSLWIPLLIDTSIISFYFLVGKMYICVYYCQYYIDMDL